MRCADTGEVGERGLDFGGRGAPGGHTVDDVGGEVGLLAVAVRVGVGGAPRRSNPSV